VKLLMFAMALTLSSVSFAQSMQNFSGDYTLNFSVSACNPNARVEVSGSTVTIVNQDQRDNRGWSTTKLTVGTTKYSPAAGFEQVVKVSLKGSEYTVETVSKRGGSEVGYVKDLYTFSDKNGRKALNISLAVATRGNVSGWGTTCGYEKK
jgi:hypothetical protein